MAFQAILQRAIIRKTSILLVTLLVCGVTIPISAWCSSDMSIINTPIEKTLDSIAEQVQENIDQGQYQQAQVKNIHALDLAETHGNWERYLTILFKAAKIKELAGENPAPEYLRALKVSEQHRLPDWQIRVYQKMAYVNKELGKSKEAVRFSRLSYQHHEKLYDHPKATQVVNLAWFLHEDKAYEEAKQELRKGEKIFADDPEGLRMIYHGWSEMYLFKSFEFDKALIYLDKMIALPTRKGRWRRAKLIANKARTLYAMGRIDDALSTQMQAMKIFFPNLSDEDVRQIPSIDTTVERVQFWFPQHQAIYLQQRGRKNKDRHDLLSALKAVQRSQEMLNYFRPRWNRNERNQHARFYRANDEIMVDIYYELWKLTNKGEYLEKIFRAIEFGRSRNILDHQSDTLPSHHLEEAVTRQKSINQLQNYLMEVNFATENKYDSLLNLINATNLEIHALNAEIRSKDPSYFLPRELQSVTLRDLQSELGVEQAFLSYFTTGSQAGYHGTLLYTMAISADTVILKRFEQENLKAVAAQFHDLLKSNQPGFDSLSCKLYDHLIEPIIQVVPQHHWVVVPDYTFAQIPLDILQPCIPGENPSFLFATKELKLTASAGLFLASQSKKSDPGFLAFAPEFIGTESKIRSTNDGYQLGSLPGARREIKVLQNLSDGHFEMGEGATKTGFMALADKYRYIHLATHAIIDRGNPDASRLIFASSNSNDNKDELHAAEIYQMNIAADLVTLSACNTGSGRVVIGEGISSLAKAFSFAGARNVLMSLWPVEDAVTAKLMRLFYTNLLSGSTPSSALRRAKIDFIRTHPGRLKHPYYWSGFILSGSKEDSEAHLKSDLPSIYKAGKTAILILLVGGLLAVAIQKLF